MKKRSSKNGFPKCSHLEPFLRSSLNVLFAPQQSSFLNSKPHKTKLLVTVWPFVKQNSYPQQGLKIRGQLICSFLLSPGLNQPILISSSTQVQLLTPRQLLIFSGFDKKVQYKPVFVQFLDEKL